MNETRYNNQSSWRYKCTQQCNTFCKGKLTLFLGWGVKNKEYPIRNIELLAWHLNFILISMYLVQPQFLQSFCSNITSSETSLTASKEQLSSLTLSLCFHFPSQCFSLHSIVYKYTHIYLYFPQLREITCLLYCYAFPF